MKSTLIFVFIFVFLSFIGCKPEEIILHGNLAGTVTDAESGMPVNEATVIVNIANDTATTADDGSFFLKSLTPGQYEIKATKHGYDSIKQNIDVVSEETKEITFSLNGIPVPKSSVSILDFGVDSSSLTFSISNMGKGKFVYVLTASQDWIKLSPFNGTITNESIDIKVTVDKTGLSENIHKETIIIFTLANQVPLPEITIPLFLNGVRDQDDNYYKVVRIGSQTWMAENLNVGTEIPLEKSSADNGIIEKYCYSDTKNNCDIYGGLYRWTEMMQYNPSDTGLIGTIQGICPVGWHLPTQEEWFTLTEYGGGVDVAGAYLKEAGFSHWLVPNSGATNESGFTGLPSGVYSPPPDYIGYLYLGESANWWTSTEDYLKTTAYHHGLRYNNELFGYALFPKEFGLSVRCVKNP